MSVDENELKIVYRSPQPKDRYFRERWFVVARYVSRYDRPEALTRIFKPTSLRQFGYSSADGALDATRRALGCAASDVRVWVFEIGDPEFGKAMESIAGRNR